MTGAVVTGANGMLGASLVLELLAHGVKVLALVRRGEGARRNLPAHPLLRVAACELHQLESFADFSRGEPYDALYHLAWEGTFGPNRDDARLQARNIRHTLDAVSLAARMGCGRFVGAGTQAEYGPLPEGEQVRPESPVFPVSGYGMAKLAAGQLGKLHAGRLGISFQWMRLLSIYGPMEKPHSLIMSTILKLLNGEEVHFTKGEQQWDFLYCQDAARAFRLLGEGGRDGQTYVLGSGQVIRLAEALRILCRAVDPAARVGIGDLPYPAGQVMYLRADLSRLTEDTGFLPRVSFPEGIRKTVDWVRENR